MTPRHAEHWQRPVARFGRDGRPVGAGVLVPGGFVVTCAHVLVPATGDGPAIGRSYDIAFPFSGHEGRFAAEVVACRPAPAGGRAQSGDLAVLRLRSPEALTIPACSFVLKAPEVGATFVVWGFPDGYDEGAPAEGVVGHAAPRGWIDVTATSPHGYFIEKGFSGAPVFQTLPSGLPTGGVLGLCAAGNTAKSSARIIPAAQVLELLAEVACPYYPDVPHDFHQAQFYAGREEPCEQVLAAAHEKGCVVVAGERGSGRTSLLKAGLRPRAHGLFGDCIILEPTADTPGDLARALTDGECGSLADPAFLARAAGLAETRKGVLIAIDNAEDLLSLPDPAGFLLRLQQLCLKSSASAGGRVGLVLSVASDQLDLLEARLPMDLLEWDQVVLATLSPSELTRAIRQPAEVLGVSYPGKLAQRIANDAIRHKWRCATCSAALRSYGASGATATCGSPPTAASERLAGRCGSRLGSSASPPHFPRRWAFTCRTVVKAPARFPLRSPPSAGP